jgi:hypothetical protein
MPSRVFLDDQPIVGLAVGLYPRCLLADGYDSRKPGVDRIKASYSRDNGRRGL